jgi:uncharacterized protein
MARLILDTSGYLAGVNVKHPLHAAVNRVLASVDEPPVLSPMVFAEIDYMVLTTLGVDEELSVIDELTGGAYEPADLDTDDLRAGRELVARCRDLKIGLTDAVNVVLAERHATNEILTTDQRHYRTLVPLSRQYAAFRLLPEDL